MILRRRDIWLVPLALTLLTSGFVALTITRTYPVEDWAWELSLSLSLTVGLTGPISHWMATLVLKNAELAKELRNVVIRDRLTDMATRDYFFEKMEAAPDAYGVSLTVDVDHFKRVNDTYGHLVGDAVIREVAQTLRGCLAPDDIVCRFGGEEFVIFLQDANKVQGRNLAEYLRSRFAAAVIRYDNLNLSVTVSIGGSMKEGSDDIEQAIIRADAALYRAKLLGRNRTSMSWHPAADVPARTFA